MTAVRQIGLLHDRVLADRARHDDQQAFDELVRRHGPAVWRLALAVTRAPATAAAALASAFAATLGTTLPVATTVALRGQLLAAVRHAAVDPALAPVALPSATPLVPTTVDGAFTALPERWRSALWLHQVEGVPAPEVAAALGIPVAAVGPLASRARAGLREQVLDLEVQRADATDCRRVLDRLGDHADGRLVARDQHRVRRHLEGCPDCARVLSDLDDLVPALRHLALPLPVAAVGAATARWRAARVDAFGPLHLVLPSGRPVPPWAERAIAGAAAAVIALGISSAVLVAGRGGKVRDDRLARSAPSGAVDGESALGTGGLPSDFDLADYGLLPVAGLTGGAGSSTTGSAAAAPAPALAPQPLPRVVATPSPAPVAPDAPEAPPAGAPEPAPEPAAEPLAQVTVGVGGVATITVGDACTGIDLAGTAIGCAPTTSDEPLSVDLGGSLLGGLGL